MIEKTLLPMRAGDAVRAKRLRECVFKRLHPVREMQTSCAEGREQVNVVRHDYVAADENAAMCGFLSERPE